MLAKNFKKGQVSTEVIVILAFSLLVISAFLFFSTSVLSEKEIGQDAAEAYNSILLLASAADSVSKENEGAFRIVTITIPASANLNFSFIGSLNNSTDSNTIGIKIGQQEFYAYTYPKVSGFFPDRFGTFKMKVKNEGDKVTIKPQLISIDKYSILLAMNQSGSKNISINISKEYAENISIFVFSSWNYSNINLNISPKSFVLNQQTQNINLIFNTTFPEPLKYYSSSIVIVANSTSQKETIVIPVSVFINAT
jgi:hypothetical protein